MIKDITFGQFFPGESFIHKLDPRFKILLVFFLIIVIFLSTNFYTLGLLLVFTLILLLVTKIPLKVYLKSLKPVLFFIILTSILNVFYIKGETLLFKFSIFNIYLEGLEKAAFVSIRIMMLILISSILTYTTSPTLLTDAIESLLKPIAKLGVDTHTFAMMMTIALRFIPTLIEETDKIMSAQKARGADMSTGSLMKRIKAVLPILIPLLISSVRRARELADAMECRCYHGGKGRTRLKILKSSFRDAVALTICIFLFCAVIAGNYFL